MGRYEQWRAFVEVVARQSFSEAGEHLGLSKSVVSRRVSELERRLGVKLLNRTTRRLSLTSAGEQLHARASLLLQEMAEMEQRAVEEQTRLDGGIKIAAPLSFGHRHLAPALADFLAEHPDIDLSLDLNDRQIDLVSEGFDMALRIGDLSDSSLIARRLGTVRFVTLASPDYLERHGEPATPAELSEHQGLYYANLPPRKQWCFGEGRKARAATPQQRLLANNGDFLLQCAEQGLGIVQTPTFLAREAIEAGRLRILLADYPQPATALHALFAPGRLIPRRMRVMTDFLKQRFGDCPAWDNGLFCPRS